jgi:hypothetical protein
MKFGDVYLYKRELLFCEILGFRRGWTEFFRSRCRLFKTDVSLLPVGPILKRQAFMDSWILEDGTEW